MVENLAEEYWNKLKSEPNRVKTLTDFYCELFEQPFSKELIKFFSIQVKIYGIEITYYAIIDSASIKDLKEGSATGLVNYFAKKRLEEKKLVSNIEDYSKYIEEYKKKITRTKKAKLEIEDPFSND